MPVYKKLVRDLIPEIIAKSGSIANTRILEDSEYQIELRTKLKEETEEYFLSKDDAHSLEELADILEVIHSLVETHGANWEELDKIRAHKAAKRGAFQKRIYLIDVNET